MTLNDPVPLVEKMSMQKKIAELEQRIAALEKQRHIVTKTTTVAHVDLDHELNGLWASVDALFKKVFR